MTGKTMWQYLGHVLVSGLSGIYQDIILAEKKIFQSPPIMMETGL